MAAFKVAALDASLTVFQYNCRSWTRQNGLPVGGVNAIAQSQDGYLWLGTSQGLVRFNGVEFKSVDLTTLPQVRCSSVKGLIASRNGDLWFGLERSGFGSLKEMAITFQARAEWGGEHINVHSLLETSAGDLWLASETLAARLTKENEFQTVLPNNSAGEFCDATAICEGANGRVWLGTARRGLYYWQDGRTTKFPDVVLDKLIVRALAEDRQGCIWVGTELGLLCYDRGCHKKELPFPWYETPVLLVDANGTVWAGTSGGGLFHFRNQVGTQFRKLDGLADDFVTALHEDQEGSLWIGTRNGLNQLNNVKIPAFGSAEGFGVVNVAVCAARRGGLWVATAEGFTHFDGRTAVTNSPDAGLANRYIKTVFEAENGDLYLINGSNDIEIVSDGKVVARHANTEWPTALAEDAKGVLVTVAGKLYRVGRDQFTPYDYEGKSVPSFGWVFNMIRAKDGSIWLAGSDGLFQLKDGECTAYTQADGLGDSKVTWVCEDRNGAIWAGTEAGIARIKNGIVRNLTREAGLPDNFVVAMVPDDHGNLWVDSGRGFFKAAVGELNACIEGKARRAECVIFDGEDAVKSAEKNQQQPGGCKTTDGRVWFPTAQGVVAINPTNIASNPIAPRVHIESVRANGAERTRKDSPQVSPGRGELEFYYAGLSFISPQKVRFRYMLEGYDSTWVDAGGRRSAFYTNLKPGSYRFHVLAGNEDGVWNSTGDSFALELLPHYYETGWFRTLAIATMVLAVVAIFGWRMRHLNWKQTQLQKANDLLEAKVGERTVELRQTNLSLQNQIEERERMETEVERIHRQLVDASRQAGQAEVASSVLHNVGNVLNSVNISTSLISDRLRGLGLTKLTKAAQLLEEHAADVDRFITVDEKGRLLPKYLTELSSHLDREQGELLREVKNLAENVDHIKEIVAMQQSHTKAFGVLETVALVELVESALKMHSAAYQRHSVSVVREFDAVPPTRLEKHKVLQILVNLLHNAKQACDEGVQARKQVLIQIKRTSPGWASIGVTDNGVGISPENLIRIFSQGFTTKKDGHGFGLHSAALAAKELGGTLTVFSAGAGRGATFTLELPLTTDNPRPLDHAREAVSASMGRASSPRPEDLSLKQPVLSA